MSSASSASAAVGPAGAAAAEPASDTIVYAEKPRRQSSWTVADDCKLRALCALHGTKAWTIIANQLPGRTGKQCRERWCNQLDPSIKKEAWTEAEMKTLLRAHAEYGNHWTTISRLLPGRTDNAVKNLWNGTLRRRYKLDAKGELVCIAREKPGPKGSRGSGHGKPSTATAAAVPATAAVVAKRARGRPKGSVKKRGTAAAAQAASGASHAATGPTAAGALQVDAGTSTGVGWMPGAPASLAAGGGGEVGMPYAVAVPGQQQHFQFQQRVQSQYQQQQQQPSMPAPLSTPSAASALYGQMAQQPAFLSPPTQWVASGAAVGAGAGVGGLDDQLPMPVPQPHPHPHHMPQEAAPQYHAYPGQAQALEKQALTGLVSLGANAMMAAPAMGPVAMGMGMGGYAVMVPAPAFAAPAPHPAELYQQQAPQPYYYHQPPQQQHPQQYGQQQAVYYGGVGGGGGGGGCGVGGGEYGCYPPSLARGL